MALLVIKGLFRCSCFMAIESSRERWVDFPLVFPFFVTVCFRLASFLVLEMRNCLDLSFELFRSGDFFFFLYAAGMAPICSEDFSCLPAVSPRTCKMPAVSPRYRFSYCQACRYQNIPKLSDWLARTKPLWWCMLPLSHSFPLKIQETATCIFIGS